MSRKADDGGALGKLAGLRRDRITDAASSRAVAIIRWTRALSRDDTYIRYYFSGIIGRRLSQPPPSIYIGPAAADAAAPTRFQVARRFHGATRYTARHEEG